MNLRKHYTKQDNITTNLFDNTSADDILYGMKSDPLHSNTTFVSVQPTFFEDEPNKKFLCGVWELNTDDPEESDYTEFAYGPTIEQAILNYRDKYVV